MTDVLVNVAGQPGAIVNLGDDPSVRTDLGFPPAPLDGEGSAFARLALMRATFRASTNIYGNDRTSAGGAGAHAPGGYNNTTGAFFTTLGNWASSGFTRVEGGQTYTLKINENVDPLWKIRAPFIWFFNVNTLAFVQNLNFGGTDGVRTLTFTAPGSAGTFYYVTNTFVYNESIGTHDPSDLPAKFTALLNGFQVNAGALALDYETPGLLPRATVSLNTKAAQARDVRVKVVGNYHYPSTRWSATEYKVARLLAGSPQSSTANGVIDFEGERKVTGSPADLETAFNASTALLLTGLDESPAFALNSGMFKGGRHGDIGRQITATAHGKTFAHIGAKHNDGTRDWWIAGIVDANNLKVFSVSGTATAWTVFTGAVAGPLVHVSGGGSTTTITPSVDVPTQLWPAVQSYTVSAHVDDGPNIINVDGTYEGDRLVYRERYGVANPVALRDWLQAGVGTFAANPHYGDPAIATQFRVEIAHVLDWTGIWQVAYSYFNVQQYTPQQVAGMQVIEPAQPVGSTLFMTVPRVTTLSGYDFAVGADITAFAGDLYFPEANYTNPTDPPSRFAYSVKVGGIAQHGLFIGFSDQTGVTKTATRLARTANAARMTTNKFYPLAADSSSGLVAANVNNALIGYRGTFNPALASELEILVLLPEGPKKLLYAYNVGAVSNYWIPVDKRLIGQPITVRKNGGGAITVHSEFVEERGILASFPAGGTELEIVIG